MASGTVEIKLSPKVREMIEGALFPVIEENKKLKEENARLQVELEQERNAYNGTRAREITLATECNAAITEIAHLRAVLAVYADEKQYTSGRIVSYEIDLNNRTRRVWDCGRIARAGLENKPWLKRGGE